MEIKNIKFHCRIKPEYYKQYYQNLTTIKLTKKTFYSFCVFRIGNFVFNCFFTGYVNITGVSSYSAISTALSCLSYFLQFHNNEYVFTTYVIDNMTAKCSSIERKIINLTKKGSLLKEWSNIISVKYNRERFPNMFIKTKYGTIIWSPNNSATTVGAKTISNLDDIYEIILSIDQL